jgi:hypothetical protein
LWATRTTQAEAVGVDVGGLVHPPGGGGGGGGGARDGVDVIGSGDG